MKARGSKTVLAVVAWLSAWSGPAAAASFRCPFPVEVWARGAPGEPDRLVGVTGGQREVALPEGAAWYVRPAGSTLLDADVAELAGELEERKVPGLSLRGFRTFGDEQLRHLAALELTMLDLSETSVTDAGVAQVIGMPRLADLSLARTSVGDASAPAIGRRALSRLDLSGTRIDDAGVAALGPQDALVELGLAATAVDDSAMSIVATKRALVALSLANTKIGDAGAAALGALPALRSVDLSATAVGDEGVERLAAAPSLVDISLSWTNVGDDAVKALSVKPVYRLERAPGGESRPVSPPRPIERLALQSTAISARALDALTSAAPTLRELDLRDTAVADSSLAALAPLPKLETLRLDGCAGVGGAAIAKLRAPLRRLGLGATKVDDATLAKIVAAHPDLEELTLRDAAIGDAGAAAIAREPRLVTLVLDGTRVTDAGVAKLAALRSLRVLRLDDTKVGDDGIAALAPLSKLAELSVAGTQVDDQGVAALGPKPRLVISR